MAAWALALTFAVEAGATPIPRVETGEDGRLRLAKRREAPHPPWPTPYALDPITSTDVLTTDLALDLDPASGALSGQLTVELQAKQAGVSSFLLYFAADLAVTGASSDGPAVNLSSNVYGAYELASISWSPALAQGETLTLTIDYAGTLACDGPVPNCDLGPTMGALLAASGLPMLFDQSQQGGYNVWGATQTLRLTFPTGFDVVAAGDRIVDMDDGTSHYSEWVVPGFHSVAQPPLMFGDYAEHPVAGSAPPTTVFRASNAPTWGEDMASWMPSILAFLAEQTGATLPYDTLSIVKLPGGWIFPGTVGYGTVYLSDDYGGPSAHYFEETLAHETSHSWWGVMVGPTDYPTTRWLVEGLATLSQIDYAAQHHAGDMPRGVYLARRYREHRGLLQHQTSPGFPAVAPAGPVELEGLDDTFWAYIRSSAALDTLRVIVGEVAFGDALRRYVTRCSASLCDTADFKQALEDEAGFSLDAEFDAYVHAAEFPTPRISWEQYPRTFQVAVDAEGLSRPLPLVLDLFLEDGSVQHARVVLGAGAPAVVEPGAPVRAVAPSRRHDATVWSRSAQTGDVDYDLEVDGFDLVACARAVGHGVGQIPGGDGVLLSDLDYDPRCDLDDDGDVDGADLDVIASDFGTVGAQP